MSYHYVSGGTIEVGSPTYVRREADEQLLKALEEGEYCYVFSASQMGKSSLRVRTKESLEQNGAICFLVDFSEGENSEQWYKNTISRLGEKLKVFPKNSELEKWLNQQEKTASTFFKFIDEIVLNKFESKKIYILYDEVYDTRNYKYSLDEFWIKIRYIYNQRSEDNRYKRLTFAFFGITTPDKLITSKSRTRLNIGKAIKLTGIKLEQANCLLPGLQENTENTERVLEKILHWTGGQPFLTQRLCKKIQQHEYFVTEDKEDICIKELVNKYGLYDKDEKIDDLDKKVDNSDDLRHFREIDKQIAFDDNPETHDALITYQKILQEGFVYESDYPDEAKELLLSGLVNINNSKVTIFCPIYKKTFNNRWVKEKIYNLCPWSGKIRYWMDSGQKNKRYLLRGKDLKSFEDWARKRRLTKNQEHYLKACYRQHNNYRNRRIVASSVFVASLVVAFISHEFSYKSKLQEIEAVNISSKALAEADNELDALKEALYAKKESRPENNKWYLLNIFRKREKAFKTVDKQASVALSEAIYSLDEYNRFSGHEDTVSHVAISRDGNTIASGSWDKTIKLWRKDGTHIATLGEDSDNGHQQEVKAVAVSDDGNIIVSGSTDKTIKIWKRDGTLIKTLHEHTKPVEAIALSPDGNLIVSGSDDKTIKLWDKDGNLIDTINQTHAVKAVAFSPDGKTIASGSEDNTIKLWNVDTRKEIKSLEGHQQGIREIAFTPDGETIASGSADSTIKLWDVDTGSEIKTFEGHDGPVYGIAINPDKNNPKNNTIVSAGVDRTIRIWSIESGREISVLEGHEDRVEDVAVTPDGKTIISGSWDSTVRLWKPDNPLFETLVGHDDVVIGVDFGSDPIASASDDRKVKLWRKDGTLITTFEEHTAEVYAVAISPDGETIVSAGADNEIKLWDKDTKSPKTIGRHEAAIWDLAITPDGQKIVSASSDNTLKIWDKNNNNPSKAEATLKDRDRQDVDVVWTVAISDDGKTIVSGGGDKTVKLWDINGKLIKKFKQGHEHSVWAVAISDDGKTIVSGGEDGKVIFWNRDGTPIKEIDEESDGHTKAVKGIAIGINREHGELVASASADKTIKIWDKEGNLKKTISGHDGRIWDVAFSPDGESLVSASEDKTLIVWNLKEILKLDEQEYGCKWIQNYLEHNSEVEEEERTICD